MRIRGSLIQIVGGEESSKYKNNLLGPLINMSDSNPFNNGWAYFTNP
jgi:hypothetical protein